MTRLFLNTVLFAFIIVFLSACKLASEDNDESSNIIVQNDQAVLDERVDDQQQVVDIEVDTTVSTKPGFAPKSKDDKAAELTLTLVAQVSAPTHDGQTLQATDVRASGNKAYVTYNVAGEVFMGAVEVYNITDSSAPVLESTAIFVDTDINGVAIHGNDLYLAGATSDSSYATPAVLKRITLSGGVLTDTVVTVEMPSFAATDVEVAGNYIYVTTGADDGQIVLLSQSDLSEEARYSAVDARGVDSDSADVAVVTGSNGDSSLSAQLISFDKNLGTKSDPVNVAGATIKHSKSTIEIKKNKAILAMGDGGTQVMCVADGASYGDVLKTIANPDPVVTGVSAELSVANAATAYKRSLFMANGEAGVYVAIADENLDANACTVDTLDLVGKLALDDILIDGQQVAQSVNHILYRNDVLFVAAGLGGLKIIEVSDDVATEDNDDK